MRARPAPRGFPATEIVRAPIVPPVPGGGGVVGSGVIARGYQPAPPGESPPATLDKAASEIWVRRIVDTVNNTQKGKLNAVASVTLAANADSTVIVDVRISAYSALLFSPLTANAAAEQAGGAFYISSQGDGTATVRHANNANTDRNYFLLIVG